MDLLQVDSCVWLNIVVDPDADQLLNTVEKLIENHKLSLIVPDVIENEFGRNHGKQASRKLDSIRTHLKEARRALGIYGDHTGREGVIKAIDEIMRDSEKLRRLAMISTDRIMQLFAHSSTRRPEVTGEILALAAQRGLEGKAPFIAPKKNSIADAILIEVFIEQAKAASSTHRFCFVTANINDFSDERDQRKPHPDIAGVFNSFSVIYETNIAAALNRVEAYVLSEETVKRVDEFTHQYSTDECPHCGYSPMNSIGKRPSVFGDYWSLFLQCPKCSFRVDTGIL